MSNKIKQINEKLRELKETRGFDMSDPRGVVLGGKSYFAVDKHLSLDDNPRSWHKVRLPFENFHIADILVAPEDIYYEGRHIAHPVFATISYPSNRGEHRSTFGDVIGDEDNFWNASHADNPYLHEKLEKWSKSESKAFHLPDHDDWEKDPGRLVTGPGARETLRNSPMRFEIKQPHEIKVLFPDESYKYDLRTEQLKRLE